jgi:hypothetical protein
LLRLDDLVVLVGDVLFLDERHWDCLLSSASTTDVE